MTAEVGAPLRGPAPTPWQRARARLRRNAPALWAWRALGLFYLLALLAPFLAPYAMTTSDRRAPFHPPSRWHWKAPDGRFHLVPFIHPLDLDLENRTYSERRDERLGLRLFVAGDPYELVPGLRFDRHLFGVESPGRVFVLGTDQLGRDILSRLLYGSRVSLTVGLVGIALSVTLGLLIGGAAGYFGGRVDTLLMRLTEVLLSIPGLYLILALRAAFPSSLSSTWTYVAIVLILSLVGWTSLGRIVRGMTLSLRTREYVLAAEALGFSPFRIIVRHILPNTLSFVIVAATIQVPGYILAEVALSFLGMGIQEPAASWGNMLQQAASVTNLETYPWILWPGVAIFLTVLAFNLLGDGLRDAFDPRHVD